jgi:hypothetical protein
MPPLTQQELDIRDAAAEDTTYLQQVAATTTKRLQDPSVTGGAYTHTAAVRDATLAQLEQARQQAQE